MAESKLPPHSLEAEQSVLGGLMLAEDAWDEIAGRLSEEDFYREDHRLLFRGLADLADTGQPRDVVTLTEWLRSRDLLDKAGGATYIGNLAADTPSAANIRAYAEIVRERSVTRQLIGAGTAITELGFTAEGRSASDILDEAEKRIFAIAERGRSGGTAVAGLGDLLTRAVERIEYLYENQGKFTGLATGLNKFDELTNGLQPSDLIIVAGRPSMGKCLAHDAEITLADGSVATIEEIVRRREARLGTLRDDLKLDWVEPSDYVDDGHKPVFEVVTRLGRRIETTLTHPFLTLEGWKSLSEIQPGDYVAVPRHLPVFGSRTMRASEIKLLAYLIGDGGLTGTTPMFTTTNARVREDFAAAVEAFGGVRVNPVKPSWRAPSWAVVTEHAATSGIRAEFAANLDRLIAGSGRPARGLAAEVGVSPNTVTYWRQGRNVPDAGTLARLAEVLEVDPDDLAPDAGNGARRSRPKPVRQWLAELGIYGVDAHGKHIPNPVFELTREQLALFLNRLFATDGWASVWASGQSQIGYASVSERLARQVQHLLLRFGVIAKLRQRWVRYGDARRPSWQLDITHAESIRRFIEEIGIHGKEESLAAVAKAVGSRRCQSNTDLVPVGVWRLLERAKGDISWNELARRAGIPDSNIHAHRRALSRRRLTKLALALQSRELLQLADSDVYWDRVESVTPLGEKQVYDLTVPGTHNFIANDICVHNTSFSMNIVENVAIKERVPVAVFSMEMSAEQLVMRMISSWGRVDQGRLRSGQLDDEDWPRITSAIAIMNENAKLFVDDTPALSPTELRARARRLKREHDIGLIVVDYLQLMQVPGTRENRTNEISEISRNLKALAKELDVPVIALSQLNRSVEQRDNKRPRMSDLRESGGIEQDADVIVFIYRDEVYNEDSDDKGVAEIIIGKQRNGPLGTCRTAFLGHFTRFENLQDHYDDDLEPIGG